MRDGRLQISRETRRIRLGRDTSHPNSLFQAAKTVVRRVCKLHSKVGSIHLLSRPPAWTCVYGVSSTSCLSLCMPCNYCERIIFAVCLKRESIFSKEIDPLWTKKCIQILLICLSIEKKKKTRYLSSRIFSLSSPPLPPNNKTNIAYTWTKETKVHRLRKRSSVYLSPPTDDYTTPIFRSPNSFS